MAEYPLEDYIEQLTHKTQELIEMLGMVSGELQMTRDQIAEHRKAMSDDLGRNRILLDSMAADLAKLRETMEWRSLE